MKVPVGIDRETQALRFISEVDSGLACHCICPACHTPLVARKGTKTTHHFAHHEAAEQRGCLETALHLMAKHVLTSQERVNFPCMTLQSEQQNTLLDEPIQHSQEFFTKPQAIYGSREEVFLAEHAIQPDVLCKTLLCEREVSIAIEVFVTHCVDEEKQAKIKAAQLSTFEIDLSDLVERDSITLEDMNRALSEPHRLAWVHIEDVVDGSLRQQLQEKTDQQTTERNEAILYWHELLCQHFLSGQSLINLPDYPYPSDVNGPYEVTIVGRKQRLPLPHPPHIGGSMAVTNIGNIKKGVMTLELLFNGVTHGLPIYFTSATPFKRKPRQSYLTLNIKDGLPPPSVFEQSLEWGRSFKAEAFIQKIKQRKNEWYDANYSKALATLQLKVKELYNITSHRTFPYSPHHGQIKSDYEAALVELEEKQFDYQNFLVSIPGDWGFGCPAEYWQVLLTQTLCRVDNSHVNVKYYADCLKRYHRLEFIEPLRSLGFAGQDALLDVDFSSDIKLTSFGLLSEYFRQLHRRRLLIRSGRGQYEKNFPYGFRYHQPS